MKPLLSFLALSLVSPQASPGRELQDSQYDLIIVKREGIMAKVAPHWKDMCSLVDAILDDRLRLGFLDQHRALTERFPSQDQFAYLADKWKARILALPRNIKNLDWEKAELDFLESRNGNSVVVVQREAGTERILRIKGVFEGKDLVDFSILAGTRVAAPVKGMEPQRTWRR